MKEKRFIVSLVTLISLLLVLGLLLIGCGDGGSKCIGNGECIVTIQQGTSGLYVDNTATRSSCGKKATWSWETNSYTGGCKVQNNIDNLNRTHGTHRCGC
ncbi:MAG: hypothetical protein FWC21_04000 [Treponema sp.]|nr:hypothetical protein [Treponema sp.]